MHATVAVWNLGINYSLYVGKRNFIRLGSRSPEEQYATCCSVLSESAGGARRGNKCRRRTILQPGLTSYHFGVVALFAG
jgi:hypothetical protein